jgi:hypothetical protein
LRRATFTGCDPLPTGQQKQRNHAEIEPDWTAEKHRKWLRPFGRPLGRIALESLFATNGYPRVGRGLWDAGRGLQKRLPISPKLPKLAGIEDQCLPRSIADLLGSDPCLSVVKICFTEFGSTIPVCFWYFPDLFL